MMLLVWITSQITLLVFHHGTIVSGACTLGDDPFLIHTLGGGLNNEKLMIYSGLMLAERQNLTYVLPSAVSLDHSHICNGFTSHRPLAYLYDVPHLLAALKGYGMRAVHDLDSNSRAECCELAESNITAGLVPGASLCLGNKDLLYDGRKYLPKLIGSKFFHRNNGELHKYLDRIPITLMAVVNYEFHKFRQALRPSQLMTSQAADMLKEITQIFGKPFAVVHVRTEADIMKTGWQFLLTEESITDRLLHEHKLPEQSLLFVCTGLEINELPVLCSKFQCFKSNQLTLTTMVEEFGNCTGKDRPRDLGALLEYQIALHGTAFYGTIHSTFSTELYAEYYFANKPAFFLNWNTTHVY